MTVPSPQEKKTVRPSIGDCVAIGTATWPKATWVTHNTENPAQSKVIFKILPSLHRWKGKQLSDSNTSVKSPAPPQEGTLGKAFNQRRDLGAINERWVPSANWFSLFPVSLVQMVPYRVSGDTLRKWRAPSAPRTQQRWTNKRGLSARPAWAQPRPRILAL